MVLVVFIHDRKISALLPHTVHARSRGYVIGSVRLFFTPRSACAARGKVISRGVQYFYIYNMTKTKIHNQLFLLKYSLSKLKSDRQKTSSKIKPCRQLLNVAGCLCGLKKPKLVYSAPQLILDLCSSYFMVKPRRAQCQQLAVQIFITSLEASGSEKRCVPA